MKSNGDAGAAAGEGRGGSTGRPEDPSGSCPQQQENLIPDTKTRD